MQLTLNRQHHQLLLQLAETGAPYEICGLLGGWNGIVSAIYPCPNIAQDRKVRYQLDPAVMVRSLHQINRTGELVGIYHSHPIGDPIPSVTDIAEATWLDVVYVIIGRGQMRGWLLRGGMTPIEVEVAIL
jgi:proteasome lid subunit RPN8/RPN11